MPAQGARRTGGCMPAQGARRTGGVHAGLRVPPARGCMPDRGPAGPPRPRGRGACRTEGAFRTGTPHRSGAPAGRGASRNVAPAPASGGLSLCAFVGRCRRATGTPARPPPVSRWAPPRSRCRRTGRGAGAASLATGRAHARGPLRIALPAGNHPAGLRRGRPAQPAASGRRRIAPERNGAPRGTLIGARRPSRGRGARLPAPPGANPLRHRPRTGRTRGRRAARGGAPRGAGFDAAPTMGVLSTWRAWPTAQDLTELC